MNNEILSIINKYKADMVGLSSSRFNSKEVEFILKFNNYKFVVQKSDTSSVMLKCENSTAVFNHLSNLKIYKIEINTKDNTVFVKSLDLNGEVVGNRKKVLKNIFQTKFNIEVKSIKQPSKKKFSDMSDDERRELKLHTDAIEKLNKEFDALISKI